MGEGGEAEVHGDRAGGGDGQGVAAEVNLAALDLQKSEEIFLIDLHLHVCVHKFGLLFHPQTF